ncbi:MAG: hypothetical protein IJ745_05690 [Bacteroidales bacterium]|nr:hypothetical protein [Bacteroidales bacterium]
MTRDQLWQSKYDQYADFVKTQHRCPSKHFDDERTLYSWWKQNRKKMNAGTMKPSRLVLFNRLVALAEQHRHVNQYQ